MHKKKKDLKIAGGRFNHDLNIPRLPDNQSIEGVPNATPAMLKKLLKKKLINPGPGPAAFPIKKAQRKSKKSYG